MQQRRLGQTDGIRPGTGLHGHERVLRRCLRTGGPRDAAPRPRPRRHLPGYRGAGGAGPFTNEKLVGKATGERRAEVKAGDEVRQRTTPGRTAVDRHQRQAGLRSPGSGRLVAPGCRRHRPVLSAPRTIPCPSRTLLEPLPNWCARGRYATWACPRRRRRRSYMHVHPIAAPAPNTRCGRATRKTASWRRFANWGSALWPTVRWVAAS